MGLVMLDSISTRKCRTRTFELGKFLLFLFAFLEMIVDQRLKLAQVLFGLFASDFIQIKALQRFSTDFLKLLSYGGVQ